MGRAVIAVNDICPMIQGEGCLTGVPMVLIRLQGCQVGCPWCDSKQTWVRSDKHQRACLEDALGTGPDWAWVEPGEVATFARRVAPAVSWALVTGGEPAEQHLAELVASLQKTRFRVALETSGTATGHLGAGLDWVTVSPKLAMPGGRAILPDAVRSAHEINWPVETEADLAALESFLTKFAVSPGVPVCLQPLFCSSRATQLCATAAINRGWRVSVHTAKYKDMAIR